MKKPTAFGKYFLLERINVGGMAEVFRAKAFGVEGFERLVAVKRILSNIAEDKEFIRMFIEEAKLSVQLNHANIAQIFDLGVVDGSYYIALEHVHGRDLRGIFDRCRKLGEAMPVAQACFIAMKVCEGLDYAHNKRDQAGRELSLVHRDVSPQNILVSFEGEVKLIDFGVAKAAGTGPSTQTGILKGKLGYMSPEQVRGLPVDRRSDVFSCGIVLYELLTGERLFAGESDFATLEKVRDVEVLPPSTYNRKIPEELERIVLKALARDVEDRYQHAIDLHDELQAFVYTAGEFYSRKDLAGWMKKTFGPEIEEETAKLESYRQLRPPVSPPVEALSAGRTASPSAAPPAVPSVAPPARSQPVTAVPSAAPPARSQRVTAAPAPADQAVPEPLPRPGKSARAPRPTDWEDDELETRVYDDDARNKSNRAHLPLQPPQSSPGIGLSTIELYDELLESVPPSTNGPAWGEHVDAGAYPQTLQGMPGSGALRSGRVPSPFASGSSNAPPPLPPEPVAAARELSAPSRLVASPPAERPYSPMLSFGSRITGVRRRSDRQANLLPIVLGGAALAVIAVIIVLLVSGKKPAATARTGAPPPVAAADPGTGFDLYVSPAGVTQWKLDGETRTDRLPSRIRGISPGPHTVQIDPPAGFLSHNQQVTVEPGKAPKVEITLQPIAGIVGVFDSAPPGAAVSLIVDGKRQGIGPSPARSPLDPRSSYQVLFEKPGYVSVNRPIAFTGALEERIVVNLERASESASPRTAPPPPAPPQPEPRVVNRPAQDRPAADKPRPAPAPPDQSAARRPADDGAQPHAKAAGVLVLGSKPPCEIAIDGASTGLHTPQKELKLPVGRHRITLTNTEFGIKDTFTVDIKADAPEKLIKDYSDKLPGE